MTIRIVKSPPASPLRDLVGYYLASCVARGLMPKSLKQYEYSLESVFLPWCGAAGVTTIAELDQRWLSPIRGSAASSQPNLRIRTATN